MNKIYLLIIMCIVWTASRVIHNYEDNLIACRWGDFWPGWIFYPIFIIIQTLKYGVYPLCIVIGLYIVFL